MRRARRALIALVVIFGLGSLGLMCQRVGARGRYAVPYSTHGAGPEGTRALYLWAEGAGRKPVRWARDLASLPEDGILVALGGCDALMARPVSRYERQSVEEWLEAGGVLVVAGTHEYLWPELGVHMWRPRDECNPELGLVGTIARAERRAQLGEGDAGLGPPPAARGPTFDDLLAQAQEDPGGTVEGLTGEDALPPARWARAVAPPAVGLGPVPLRKPASVVVHDPGAATTFLDLDGAPAGVVLRRGRGAVVALASASPFQNRELHDAEGGVLFGRLVGAFDRGGPVIFDEYHLGVGERRSFTQYLRSAGGGSLALQVLVVVGLLLWRAGTRFGTPDTRQPPPPAGTASYVSAIGTLYSKAGDPAGAVALLTRHALQRIADHHHLPSAEPEGMARHLEDRGRAGSAGAVRRLGVMAREPGTERRHLVSRSREIDELMAEAIAGEQTV